MCDYSLASVPNRLAVEGEPLVAYRFSTGSMGVWSKKNRRISGIVFDVEIIGAATL